MGVLTLNTRDWPEVLQSGGWQASGFGDSSSTGVRQSWHFTAMALCRQVFRSLPPQPYICKYDVQTIRNLSMRCLHCEPHLKFHLSVTNLHIITFVKTELMAEVLFTGADAECKAPVKTLLSTFILTVLVCSFVSCSNCYQQNKLDTVDFWTEGQRQ